MSYSKRSTPHAESAPLTIEQLEIGLKSMTDCDTDLGDFWRENIEAFRQTVFAAIRETSDTLLSPEVPLRWRLQLERQLEELMGYLDLMDRQLFQPPLTSGEARSAFPAVSRQLIH